MKNVVIFLLFLIHLIPLNILFSQMHIAVLKLDSKGVSETEASILTDRLRTELFQTEKFIVLEREKMDEILVEQGFQLSGCTSNECIVEAGKLIGVQQIVGGSVSKFGNIYSISARLISVESGRIINTATFDHDGRIEDLLKIGVKNIALNLADIDVDDSTIDTDVPVLSKEQPSGRKYKFFIGGSYAYSIGDVNYQAEDTPDPMTIRSGQDAIHANGYNIIIGVRYNKHFFILGLTRLEGYGDHSERQKRKLIMRFYVAWNYELLHISKNIYIAPGLAIGSRLLSEDFTEYQAGTYTADNIFYAPNMKIQLDLGNFTLSTEYSYMISKKLKIDQMEMQGGGWRIYNYETSNIHLVKIGLFYYF